MENRVIIYGRSDGGVSIFIPGRGLSDQGLTDDEIFEKRLKRLPADAINPQIINRDQIPSDRIFRNAWEHGGDKVQVNMDNARGIHMDRIRKARDAKLKELDVETMKVLGKGDNDARDIVEAKKQILRDLPETFDLSQAKTPEELIILWPAELL